MANSHEKPQPQLHFCVYLASNHSVARDESCHQAAQILEIQKGRASNDGSSAPNQTPKFHRLASERALKVRVREGQYVVGLEEIEEKIVQLCRESSGKGTAQPLRSRRRFTPDLSRYDRTPPQRGR